MANDAAAIAGDARLMLWIDSVGSYWLALGEVVTIGQPKSLDARPAPASRAANGVDVPLLADLSSRHAVIRRDGDQYVIEALRDTTLGGRAVAGAACLAPPAKLGLGHGVALTASAPHPLSASLRLDFASPHRTLPRSDAIILWADVCVLGPRPPCHIVCGDWTREVTLYRESLVDGRVRLSCRAPGGITVDGVCYAERAPLTAASRVELEGGSFSLEAL